VRAGLLTVVLALVLLASALNLFLGGLWVAALVAVTLLRRRVSYGAWFVLGLSVAAAVGAARLDWLGPPPAASYSVDEAAWLRHRLARIGLPAGLVRPTDSGGFARAAAALRARLQAVRQEEFRHTARQLEQRAVAAIAVSRDLGRLRARAGAEVSAVEDTVRQLALTLTAPEFRDLEAREARLAAWFEELEARLAAAHDQADLDAVSRALEPAALAGVSLRALREDLARFAAGSAALVRALTGGSGVTASVTARLAVDEPRGLVVEERQYLFEAAPPLRITRLDVGALRQGTAGGGVALSGRTLAYGVEGGELRPVAGAEVAPGGGASRIVVVDRRERPVMGGTLTTPLRPIRFARVRVIAEGGPAPDFPVRVLLGDGVGPEPLLVVEAGPPHMVSLTAPRAALHYVSAPGSVTTGPAADVWAPAGPDGSGPEAGALGVELVPGFLRNPAYARTRAYLYAPNLTAFLAAIALAALTSVLLRPRPRPAPPPASIPGSV
jgi:hypothetical protein